jgi:hypothetical protein
MDEPYTLMNSTGQILYGVIWSDQYYSSKCMVGQMLYIGTAQMAGTCSSTYLVDNE